MVRTLRDESAGRALVEQVAAFLGKEPGAVWDAWEAARDHLRDDRHADERLANILFEPGPAVDVREPAGYRLPPWHGALADREWVRAVKQNQVAAFRHEAEAAIRAVEERDVDQTLVRLPETDDDD